MMFPRVEKYRQEVKKGDYLALTDREASKLKEFYYSTEFCNMIGGPPSIEVYALLDMLISEKVPPNISEGFIMRYVCETVILRSITRHN